ncbi:MAG: iron ABC transporter permease [Halanaerobiales bacterium]|nr:iron ABC transporter permease [Halanaerobiales bacterium]
MLNKIGFNNKWSVISLIIIIFIILPSVFIFLGLFEQASDNWVHIKTYLLKDYVFNSFILTFFTGLFSIIIGVSLAWIVNAYDFKFSNFFKWALILPMAIPPYIGSYTYVGLLNYTGVIQTFFRNNLSIIIDPSLLNIMNLPGAIFIYTIFLYPYVYLITNAFFKKQSASIIEVSKTLGKGSFEIFLKVMLPLSRGAYVGGATLVVLEVLNDYGVVKYFGISTFSTSIFQTWFALGDTNSAIKLSASLMILVFIILVIERISRGDKKYNHSSRSVKPLKPYKLKGKKSWAMFFFPAAIFLIGFLVPVAQLIHWSIISYGNITKLNIISILFNSIGVSFIGSILVIIAAVIIANTVRVNKDILTKNYARIAIMGYSIPGAVIAIGVMMFFLKLDSSINMVTNYDIGLILSTSIFMLIFAYFIRFLAIGFNSVESGFQKVGSNYFEASRTLGKSITETFFKVDLPMLKPSLISGFLLVSIEILKELPLTLILRPFNFNTLATRAFEYANDEMIHESAVLSLILIIVSVILIYTLTSYKKKGKR